MPTQNGSEYITHCRTLGFSDAEITAAMKKAAWQDMDIQAAFVMASQKTAQPQMAHTTNTHKSKLILWVIISAVSVLLLGAAAVAIFVVLRS